MTLVNSSELTIKNKKIVELKFQKSKNLTFFKGDLRDIEFISNVFQNQRLIRKPINGVIHYAA